MRLLSRQYLLLVHVALLLVEQQLLLESLIGLLLWSPRFTVEKFADPALLLLLLLLLLVELWLGLAGQTDSREGRHLGQSPDSGRHHAAPHHPGHVGDAVVDVLDGAIDAQHVGEVVLVDAQHPLQGGHGILGTVRSSGQFAAPGSTVGPRDRGLTPAPAIPHIVPHHRLSVSPLQSSPLSHFIISQITANTPIIPAISAGGGSS